MTANWQYQAHPAFSDTLLVGRARAALLLIAGKTNAERLALIQDTRPIHAAYFAGLTPPASAFYAGHYRGEPFSPLDTYSVGFGGMVGTPPQVVTPIMVKFGLEADRLLQTYEIRVASNAALSPAQKLYRLAELAAALFVAFLTIHPYADGNGHMSRMLIHLCFARYGHKICMPLHPRPQPPLAPLDVMIDNHRRGNTAPLVMYLLSTI